VAELADLTVGDHHPESRRRAGAPVEPAPRVAIEGDEHGYESGGSASGMETSVTRLGRGSYRGGPGASP